MAKTLETAIAVIGIDIGKNSFHVVGLDRRCDRSGHVAKYNPGSPTCRLA